MLRTAADERCSYKRCIKSLLSGPLLLHRGSNPHVAPCNKTCYVWICPLARCMYGSAVAWAAPILLCWAQCHRGMDLYSDWPSQHISNGASAAASVGRGRSALDAKVGAMPDS